MLFVSDNVSVVSENVSVYSFIYTLLLARYFDTKI